MCVGVIGPTLKVRKVRYKFRFKRPEDYTKYIPHIVGFVYYALDVLGDLYYVELFPIAYYT